MVFLSSRNSPLTSTAIFFDRSPVATAVVTSAMLRTCAVRLPAIEFTESVRSFHVPATPFTFAWPPSLPSVPTSRATRVTSAANEPSWSTILLTVLAVRRNSPCSGRPSTSSAIVCDRSPCATAPITRAVSLVGMHQVVDQQVDGVDRVAPEAGDVAQSGPPRELAFLADDPRQSGELLRHSIVALDDVVEGIGDASEQSPGHSTGRRTLASPRLSAFSALRMTAISSVDTLVRSSRGMLVSPAFARVVAARCAREYVTWSLPARHGGYNVGRGNFARRNSAARRIVCKNYNASVQRVFSPPRTCRSGATRVDRRPRSGEARARCMLVVRTRHPEHPWD